MAQWNIEEEAYPHEYLWRAGEVISEIAERDSDPSYHTILPAIVTTYFAYEAFLNFLGFVAFRENWTTVERGLDNEGKLDKIVSKLPANFAYDKGARPYQSIKELSKFRNEVVHAKVKVKKYTQSAKEDEVPVFGFVHRFHEFCTVQNLRRTREDVKRFCDLLRGSLQSRSDHPHLVFPAFQGAVGSGEAAK